MNGDQSHTTYHKTILPPALTKLHANIRYKTKFSRRGRGFFNKYAFVSFDPITQGMLIFEAMIQYSGKRMQSQATGQEGNDCLDVRHRPDPVTLNLVSDPRSRLVKVTGHTMTAMALVVSARA